MSKVSAYEEFRQKLLDGVLQPGQFVTQAELAAVANVSVAAAREAIQKLEHESLLKVHPQRGIQIAEITLEFIRNAFGLRKMLECEAVRLFANDDGAFEAKRVLAETIAVLDEARYDANEDVLERAVEIDWAFHDLIIARLGNLLVSEVYQINAVRLRLIKLNNRLTPGRVVGALEEHLRILECCTKGDSDGAAKAMAIHIDTAMSRAIHGI